MNKNKKRPLRCVCSENTKTEDVIQNDPISQANFVKERPSFYLLTLPLPGLFLNEGDTEILFGEST
jgi:hypothetical protein